MRAARGGSRGLTLGLLVLVAVMSYVDRQIFTLFQDDIKAELKLDDGQLGLLTGMAFAAFYALASFPIARYADRGDRRLVIAACVTFWSVATAACGLANNFWQMLLARIGLAAGEAGAGPASNALLVEIFPPERRTSVISVLLAANAVGLSGGLAIGGWLSHFYPWRTIFIILGVPGVLLGLLVWIFAAEPRRSTSTQSTSTETADIGDLLALIARSSSLRWAGLLFVVVPVAGYAFILWGASFFQRVHGLDKAETGFWLGGAMAGGLVIGNLLAGWVSDRYGHRSAGFNGWFSGAGLLIAFPFALGFIFASNPYVSLFCFLIVKFMMTLHQAPIISLCFAQVPANMRAMLSAAISMTIGLAGIGLGVTAAGYLSTAFTPNWGVLSLRPALATLSICLLIGAAAAVLAGRRARPLEPEA